MIDHADDFCSVHLGHLYVHQHQGGLFVVQDGECLGDVLACKYLPVVVSLAVQYLLEQLQLQMVVVEYQNLMVGKGLQAYLWQGGTGLAGTYGLLLVRFIRCGFLGRRRILPDGYGDGKGRAHAFFRLQANLTAQEADELMGDGQSQACAFYALCILESCESLEHPSAFLGSHAHARIRHFYNKVADACRRGGLDEGGNGNLSFLGVLDGVADEVVQHLSDAESICLIGGCGIVRSQALPLCRHVLIGETERQVLFLSLHPHALGALPYERGRRECRGVQFQQAVFQFVIVEERSHQS